MKKLFLIPLFLIYVVNIFAESVSEDVARKAATNFLLQYSRLKSGTLELNIENTTGIDNTTTFYAFSVSGGGWILISADDVATPVLAYSTTGDWNEEEMNPAAKRWIDQYRKEIFDLVQQKQENETSKKEWQLLLNQQFSDAVVTVSPLITTQWDQNKYYNDLCPVSSASSSSFGGRVPTGCVATAMAQIMKYYNYPQQGIGSYSYNSPFGLLTANFGSSDYNWSSMPQKATASNPALATLMLHCGISVGMNYDPNGSGASSEVVPYAMKTYFNYDEGMRFLTRDQVANDELWRTVIRTELLAGRPVYYAGSGPAGGHAFVCDGFDRSNPTKFHINWGWSGNSNGYFAIGALSTSSSTFNEFNKIILGIKPRSTPDYICRIEAPVNGSKIDKGTNLSISTKTVKGNTVKAILFVDDVKIDSVLATPFNFTLTTSTLAPGPHYITIKATDGTNWDSHEASFSVLSSSWQGITVSPSLDSLEVEQIFAVDENVVWAVLGDFSSKNSSIRKYIKTTDGGASWTVGSIECSTCGTMGISNIHALSATKAYACLNPGNATGGAILYTSDGGTTWTLQPSANFAGSWANWVYFFDENNGVCMGDSYKPLFGSNYNFSVFTTSNAGSTWNKVTSANLPVALTNEAGTVNFFDAVGNTIWFGTGNGRIYKSTDKGLTWKVKDGVLGNVQTNVKFKDANNGFAFGGLGTSDFGFKRTKDGGETWVEAIPGGYISGQDFEFVPGTDSTWINSGVYSSVSIDNNRNYYWLDSETAISTTVFLSPALGWGGSYFTANHPTGIYKWTGNLTPSLRSKVVIRVKDSFGVLVKEAAVVVNGQLKNTNDLGLVNFDVKSFGNPESFQVVKTGYSPSSANFQITNNDTIDVVLSPSYTVSFSVKDKSGASIKDASVIFNGSQKLTDASGTAVFANVAIGETYPYAVVKSRYYAGYGNVEITENKNLDVTLISETTAVKNKENLKLTVFPNPATEVLNIFSEEKITGVEFISLSGQTVFAKNYSSEMVQIPVSQINTGEYIVKIAQGKKEESIKVFIKH